MEENQGVRSAGTPLHPCLIEFLENQRDLMPNADWNAVRLHPYFKIEGDIITEMAFARGMAAITRRNDIYVRVPDQTESLDGYGEKLAFHELVHVDQYASGRLDLPDYAASTAYSYANGNDAKENSYEVAARELSEELLSRWVASEQRRKCHPDAVGELRAESERPLAQYAIFSRDDQEYKLVEMRLHQGKQFQLKKAE